jgi:hypothetical protein
VIAERDAEAGRDQQHCEHRELKPINAKVPQVKRHGRECENEGADQERTRRPIDAVDRDAEIQLVCSQKRSEFRSGASFAPLNS